MLFAIVENNFVIWGPKPWNKRSFDDVILTDCEIEANLPQYNENNQVITVSDNVKIYPVIRLEDPIMNSKIQRLEGPWWNFTDTHVEMSYTVVDHPIDFVKGTLKNIIAANRYIAEVSGVKMTVQDIEVTVDTARGSRDIFFSAYATMSESETIGWKFPEAWLTLTYAELGEIVAIGKAHIQTCFDWERTKDEEIDACATLEQLDAVVLEYSQVV
jgi:hypothetical protein